MATVYRARDVAATGRSPQGPEFPAAAAGSARRSTGHVTANLQHPNILRSTTAAGWRRFSLAGTAAARWERDDGSARHDLSSGPPFRAGKSFFAARGPFIQRAIVRTPYTRPRRTRPLAMSAPFAGARPHDVLPDARHAADRALALDSTAADAHMARAVIAMFYDWDLATAGREFERSIALNPNDAETHLFYFWLLAMQNRTVEARTQIETAAMLDRCR
jgi:hypothetical protein